MPIADIATARDAIYEVFRAAWAASAYTAVPVFWPDVRKDFPTTGSWVRVHLQHNGERQRTIGGAVGNRRYGVWGILTFQVFTESGDGGDANDAMCKVIKTAYRGVNTGADAITFRNVRVVEAGQDGGFWQMNVMVDFDYDEIA